MTLTPTSVGLNMFVKQQAVMQYKFNTQQIIVYSDKNTEQSIKKSKRN